MSHNDTRRAPMPVPSTAKRGLDARNRLLRVEEDTRRRHVQHGVHICAMQLNWFHSIFRLGWNSFAKGDNTQCRNENDSTTIDTSHQKDPTYGRSSINFGHGWVCFFLWKRWRKGGRREELLCFRVCLEKSGVKVEADGREEVPRSSKLLWRTREEERRRAPRANIRREGGRKKAKSGLPNYIKYQKLAFLFPVHDMGLLPDNK